MENKEKVKLNDDLLDKVVGGIDDDEESWKIPEWTPPPHYPIWHAYCGHTDYYDTPHPEFCNVCGMPIFLKEIPE